MIRLKPQAVLEFWFGVDPDPEIPPEGSAMRWFMQDDDVDREIVSKFSEHIPFAAAGTYDDWRADAESRLALIILLDQFTRNSFRGSPLSWASDAKARELTREGLAIGHDMELKPVQRLFFYLPYEHAEDPELQAESVRLFRELVSSRSTEALVERYGAYFDYAIKHQMAIERWGRFPHRNQILGRESTAEETAFLATGARF